MSLTQSISLYCSYIELLLGNLQLYTGPYFKLVRKKKKKHLTFWFLLLYCLLFCEGSKHQKDTFNISI